MGRVEPVEPGSPNRIGGLTLATVTLDPPLPPPPSTPLGSFDSFDSPLGSDDGRALGDRPGSGRRWVSLVTAEVSLLAVHLAVVWGFVRVYDTTFLGDLVAFTLAGTATATAARRARLRPAVASLISLTGLALVSAWLLFPDTLAFGVPSTATIRAATDAAKTAGREFGTVIAPTPALVGFQLLTGVAIWGAVHFADWAAFRLRATVEALVPAGIVFGFVSVLSGDDHRVAAAVAFALTTLTYVANHRAHLACVGDTWLGSSPMAGAASLRRTGLAMVAVAVVAGSVLAPLAPGFSQDPLVRWRQTKDGGSQRDTVSPIVDVRGRILRQTNRVMFTVRSTAPAYWRLTSLNHFDGRIWSSSAEFRNADGTLPSSTDRTLTTRRVVQGFEIVGLGALWAPAAFEARELPQSSGPLLWDRDSSTLIVDDSLATSDGVTYTVASEVPVLDPSVLRAAAGSDPTEIRSTYLNLPLDLPERVRTEAEAVVAGLDSRYDQARALQDFFQSERFTYSTEVPEGHGNDALVAFLDSGAGYCEQFAGTYAAMARAVGLPARVAVGFTPGDADAEDPTFHRVRGVHAHAWPEVYFSGIGWVPFEPTKGRGIPGAESYTGLTPAQEQGVEEPASTTTTSTTTIPLQPGTSVPAPPATTPPPPIRGTSLGAPDRDEPSVLQRGAIALAAVVIIAGAIVVAAPWVRRRMRRRGQDPRSRTATAWADIVDPLRWHTGTVPEESETHQEVVLRAAPGLGELASTLGELADLTTTAAWSPDPPTTDQADRAVDLGRQFRHQVLASQTARQRVRRRLSWREAFGIHPNP